MNESAHAVGIVKVVCPTKRVREFNIREILERILLDLKEGVVNLGHDRLIVFSKSQRICSLFHSGHKSGKYSIIFLGQNLKKFKAS